MAAVTGVTLVIPTHGRPERLRECLAACQEMDYPARALEIVVVDDGSAPPAVAEPGGRFAVRLLRQDQAGPAAARNRGIAAAGGELIAFLDDDCRPDRDWVARMAEAHRMHPEALLGGRTGNGLPDLPCACASQLLVDYLYEAFPRYSPALRFFTSNNMAAPAAALRAVGGFDPSFPLAAGEDRDLGERWLRSGRELVAVAGARVTHFHPLTLGRFWRQQFHYGRGARVLRKRREARGQESPPPWPGFFRGLIAYPLREGWNGRNLRLAGLLALSQVAGFCGFVYER